MRVGLKRGEYGTASQWKGGGHGRSLRKPLRPAAPCGTIPTRGNPGATPPESNPVCVPDDTDQYRTVAISEQDGGHASLAMHFPNQRIGKGGPTAWPPRSPDFWLWGHIDSIVYATPLGTRDELITPGIFVHVRRNHAPALHRLCGRRRRTD
ncbi:hypothetical protein PR048_027133 [Dryococelus australis]|uniref:Uncharacterized protein n=1 Tax=Dryococelus australis TaxID=614101 RepID=A0ABQ9GEL1_9NEOP|nr:hypothetical protein PR048_027133 [Dryococelus australis]